MLKRILMVAAIAVFSVMLGNTGVKAEEVNVWDQVLPEQTDYVGAVGTTKNVNFNGLDQITDEYSVSVVNENNNIATIDENRIIHFVSTGYTTMTFSFSVNGQVVHTTYLRAYVTNPQLLQKDYYVAPNKTFSLPFSGIDPMFSTVSITQNTPGVLTVNAWNSVTSLKNGYVTLNVNIDGAVFSVRVIVSNPKLSSSFVLFYKGKSSTLKVSGQSGLTGVSYKSSSSSVATVSSKGVIKAKKIGKATITVTVDGKTLTCPIEVTYKKAYQMINHAKKVLGYKYSQARRMSKYYFDCSSLVWRMYKKVGVYIGSRYVAPTAAAEAKTLVRGKKIIARKRVAVSKLRAGDLLFFKGKYNRRYKNIYHTAIYIGNGKIIHANGYSVAYGSYWDYYYRNNIAFVERPLK